MLHPGSTAIPLEEVYRDFNVLLIVTGIPSLLNVRYGSPSCRVREHKIPIAESPGFLDVPVATPTVRKKLTAFARQEKAQTVVVDREELEAWIGGLDWNVEGIDEDTPTRPIFREGEI